MIKTEFYETRQDGVNLYRTYSDVGLRIQQETGSIYDEAIDVENSGHTYVETDEYISEDITDTQALNILLGNGFIENESEDS